MNGRREKDEAGVYLCTGAPVRRYTTVHQVLSGCINYKQLHVRTAWRYQRCPPQRITPAARVAVRAAAASAHAAAHGHRAALLLALASYGGGSDDAPAPPPTVGSTSPICV